MKQGVPLCVGVVLATCLIAVNGAPASLWNVMDASKQEVGVFWQAINISEFTATKDFTTLAMGNYTILAPSNATLLEFASNFEVTNLAMLKLPNISQMVYPLFKYHFLPGIHNFSSLPLNVPTPFPTALTTDELCLAPGPTNITRVSDTAAVVAAGGNAALMNLSKDGPLASNTEYAVYPIDKLLSPCCLDLDFTKLDVASLTANPALAMYLSGADIDNIVTKILGFLTYALQFIKENAEMLNTTPYTVLLPYPRVIAAALDTLDPSLLNTDTYKSIFLNHVIAKPVTFDTITAAGGSEVVDTVLNNMYSPFSCNNSVTASLVSSPTNYTQLLPTFNNVTTSASLKLCNGGIVYFANDVLLPCNLTDAVYSVANNITSTVKSQQTGGTTPSPASSVASSPPMAKGVTASSPASMVAPVQWAVNLVLAACMLLLAVVR